MNRDILKRLAGILFIAITVWYSLWILQPPEPKPATASPAVFSAERAFEHVQQIGQVPHPLGSQENARVRTYIVNELHKLGVQTAVKEGLVMQHGMGLAAYIHNTLAKIPGTDPKKTILLMAHYDSVPNGRGAGDNGAGVAAILEVIRALKSQEPLKNNVWILFTGGEEWGLLGAEFFIRNNPHWKEIDLVMNVEGRGSSGASIMFETSSQNAALITHFAKAAAHPVANSLTYTVYKLIPNDTDLSVMKEAGLTGLNFAFIGDYLNYHTLQDNIKNLSLASLQHHGSNLLSNVRYFGNRNFNLESNRDMVYFNGLFGGLVTYPGTWSLPIAIVSAILFVTFLIIGFVRDKFSIGKYLLSILGFILVTALGTLLTYAGWTLMESLHPAYQWLAHDEVYVHKWYLWGFSALTLAVGIACYRWLNSKLGGYNLKSGIFTVWLLLSLIVAWYLPTASYLFIWPMLFAAAGWIITSTFLESTSWKAFFTICIGLIPAVFIVFPYIPLVQITMTTEMLWVCMLLLMLLIGLCWPLINTITWEYTVPASSALVVLFIIAMIGGSINSGFKAEHKKQNSLIYAANLPKQKAWWLSGDPEPDAWTSQFLGDKPKVNSRQPINFISGGQYLKAKAPFKPIKKAQVTLLADSTADSLRYVSLRVQSITEALRMRFSTDLRGGFVKVHILGKELYNRQQTFPGQRPRLHRFYFLGDLSNPVKLTVAVPAGTDSLSFDIQFVSKKLFEKIMSNYEPRLPYMMPIPFTISDAVVWKQRVHVAELKRKRAVDYFLFQFQAINRHPYSSKAFSLRLAK